MRSVSATAMQRAFGAVKAMIDAPRQSVRAKKQGG